MDVLPPGWQNVSAEGLVALVVIAVLLGWLVPKRWHDRAMADKDATIEWQRKAIESLTGATTNLAVSAKTSAAALRSVARETDAPKGGDE